MLSSFTLIHISKWKPLWVTFLYKEREEIRLGQILNRVILFLYISALCTVCSVAEMREGLKGKQTIRSKIYTSIQE